LHYEELLTKDTADTLFTFLYIQFSLAQSNEELRKEIETLKEGQKVIQKELEEIKKLIRKLQAPRPASFKEVVTSVDDGPV